MAEILYKQNKIDDVIFKLAKQESQMRQQDKFLLHLLKGKCYDKQKQYKKASLEYQLCYDAAVER